MNVITAYLDTMFAAYPASPRLAEAKAELQAMMEDAYTSYREQGMSENEAVGRVITEFGNLDELAPQLGISAEIAPVPAAQIASAPVAGREPLAPAPITLDEAEAYTAARRRTQTRFATAQALFVLSPAVLIVLSTLAAAGVIGLGANESALIGVLVLLGCVAAAVLILVQRRQLLTPFARITAGDFTRSGEVDRWAGALASQSAHRRTTALQVAVGLWILAIVPVLTLSMLTPPEVSRTWIGVALAAMLLMIAGGLFLLLKNSGDAATAATLMQSRRAVGPGAREDRRSLVGVVASIYGPLLLVVYLAWSLIGGWERSWIVWPVGAVLFGAIVAGIRSWERYRAQA
ncbi:hypothetical protein IF188_07810 [Microbacterium sp. NEAU-LLC]|uniref:DUF1700 domain-containing protein n=1 Tax=Microbacterium helvum TaxID=2773713 RepID=A0ABR8NLQ1_9MICO|nr:permease prefix domain 1-containing protein [Microbacterium helvum]MBD3941598.1 hypothetical protein [Microbacterium helvum]